MTHCDIRLVDRPGPDAVHIRETETGDAALIEVDRTQLLEDPDGVMMELAAHLRAVSPHYALVVNLRDRGHTPVPDQRATA